MAYGSNDVEFDKAVAEERRREEFDHAKAALFVACEYVHPKLWSKGLTKATRDWVLKFYERSITARDREIQRAKKDALRKSALSKLTLAEREALDLSDKVLKDAM